MRFIKIRQNTVITKYLIKIFYYIQSSISKILVSKIILILSLLSDASSLDKANLLYQLFYNLIDSLGFAYIP